MAIKEFENKMLKPEETKAKAKPKKKKRKTKQLINNIS